MLGAKKIFFGGVFAGGVHFDSRIGGGGQEKKGGLGSSYVYI